MKRIAILAALVAAACGGGGNKANPATSATFNYASSTPVNPMYGTVDATASALTSITAYDASPGVGSASNVAGALFTAADVALGGSFGFAAAPVSRALPLFREVRAQALTLGDMPGSSLPPNCGAVSNGGNTVTFDPAVCKVVDNSTPGTTVTATLGGQVTRAALGSVTWDLAIAVTIADPQMNVAVHYDDAGNVAVTPTTVKAHQEASIHATASAGNQSVSLGMAQAADLDVVYAPPATCSTRVTSGTFEAKRVWTEVPQQLRDQNPAEFQNKGVKLTWTNCGTATAQFAAN